MPLALVLNFRKYLFLFFSKLYSLTLPGMFEHSSTGQLLPILVGTSMDDPSGTGQMVPILGAERDAETDNLKPLGGTMEDPDGDGK